MSPVARNETATWRFVANPDTSELHAEIAKMFWLLDTNIRGIHFTHTANGLSHHFGVSVHEVRKIQYAAGVLQPPLNTAFKVDCAGKCNFYLNTIRFKSRSEFLAFVQRDWWCNECIDKQRELRNAEYARQREVAAKNELANAAVRKQQLQQRYGHRIVGDCPLCDGVKVIRKSGNGGMFIGCSEFPDCDYRSPLPKPVAVAPIDTQELEEAKRLLALSPKCLQCGSPMIYRTGKYGPFLGCSNYPQCLYTVRVQVSEPKENLALTDADKKFLGSIGITSDAG